MVTSQNGYPANDISLTKVYRIPGTSRDIRLADNEAGELLVHFAARFDKRVESIDNDGQLDDWGYDPRDIRGPSEELSNHASGTAEELNAPEHPRGKRGTFSRAQVQTIHALLDDYDGCIRWGGDYVHIPDEMHFEIDKNLAACKKTLEKLKGKDWSDMATKDEVKAAAFEAIFAVKIPVPPGSKAEKRYGKGTKISLPNAIYWSLAESTDDATYNQVAEIAKEIENL